MVPTGGKAGGGAVPFQSALWSLPEPESAGASTYVIVLEADAEGNCGYLPEPDRPRQFKLGRAFASTRIGFIHTLRSVLLIDPSSLALRGLAAYFEGRLRVYYFGTMWGMWVDDEGHRHTESTPLASLNSPKFFIRVGDKADRIRVEFGVGTHNLELFIPSVRKRLRQAGSDFRLALDFAIPTGKFLLAEVVATQPDTGVAIMAHPVEAFPVRWPQPSNAKPLPAGQKPPAHSPAASPPPDAPAPSAPPRPDLPPKQARQEAPPPPTANPSPTPAQGRAAAPPRPKAGQQQAAPVTAGPQRSSQPLPPSPSQARPAEPSRESPPAPAGAAADESGPAATGGGPAVDPRLRVAPRLRLKPRAGSENRSPSGAGAEGSDSIITPPPPLQTSYRMRPGQISDPLGRRTPVPEPTPQPAAAAEPPPPPKSTRLREPVRAQAADTIRPRPEALTKTENLSTREMIECVREEDDAERRWKMIEPNLMMGRAERTYSLIAQFAELISDRSPEWPAARLRAAFSSQPGAVLIGIMDRWHMNQVLAVAETNSESAKIMQWLREREVDRMLRLKIDREITTAEEARKALRVDRGADEASIRKTWRILLQFLNADHGRSDEKAIHRQKDEIAKYLQTARDFLLRVTFH